MVRRTAYFIQISDSNGCHFTLKAALNQNNCRENQKKLYPMLVYRIINEYFRSVSSKVKRSPHILRHSL